jgi:hypothetical protein
MIATSIPFLTNLIALAGILLGLSLFVQVFQELWKYLTGSKSKAYTKVLVDALGPWVAQLLRSGTMPDVRGRRPFQFRRLRPTGELRPLQCGQLLDALERSSPPWYLRAIRALELEMELNKDGSVAPSPAWREFLGQLDKASPGSPGYHAATKVVRFLDEWGQTPGTAKPGRRQAAEPNEWQPGALLAAFRHEFLPQLQRVATQYPQIMQNYDYEYRRRNMRQTVLVALLVTLAFSLPFDRIYQAATQVSPEQASQLAETAVGLFEADMSAVGEVSDTVRAQMDTARDIATAVMSSLGPEAESLGRLITWDDVSEMRQQNTVLRYLLGCLLTALLVSFGAPVWHDLARTLLRLQRGGSRVSDAPLREAPNV